VAVLEPDLYSELVVHLPLDTYHKAEAREMRDAAWIAGQTPLKPSEIAIIDGVRDAIQHRPDVARLFLQRRRSSSPMLSRACARAHCADLPKLLALAAHDNVAVKISGACTLSREPFPYKDLWDPLVPCLRCF